ncbi:hypothetical protein ABS71_06305 [bacterium SCN 62-11]|nr:hypothetical protein [Candidatus Eremiobacteraeota bacterium]ODT73952.1 MAG: hypothetical protein ABS71_06305 [bacterium SCN 62-11]
MAFNPMMMNPQFGGGMPPGGGGGLMGQLGRGMQDGSLVGREKGIAANAVMDAKMTEMMAKLDGVVTPQEKMAILQKKFKASHMMNNLRTNGMGNVSGEAMQRKMQGLGGPGGCGPNGPGGFGGPPPFGPGGFSGPGPIQGAGNVSISAAISTGGTARAVAGPNGAFAQAF